MVSESTDTFRDYGRKETLEEETEGDYHENIDYYLSPLIFGDGNYRESAEIMGIENMSARTDGKPWDVKVFNIWKESENAKREATEERTALTEKRAKLLKEGGDDACSIDVLGLTISDLKKCPIMTLPVSGIWGYVVQNVSVRSSRTSAFP